MAAFEIFFRGGWGSENVVYPLQDSPFSLMEKNAAFTYLSITFAGLYFFSWFFLSRFRAYIGGWSKVS